MRPKNCNPGARRGLWGVMAMAVMITAMVPAGAQSDGGHQETVRAEDERVWTVAVLADLNGSYGSTEYGPAVEAAVDWLIDDLRPDGVVIAGDMVAGQHQGVDHRAMWRAFHKTVTDPLRESGLTLAVTPGNHDASGSAAFWEERVEYARQWALRRLSLDYVDARYYPFHYAFKLGPALFLSLDGTEVGELDERQLAWIDEMLANHSGDGVRILLSHLPQYAVAQRREEEVLGDDRLADLIDEYGVEMMISGHHHAYYPGWRGETHFLHASALGSGPRVLIGEGRPRRRSVAVVRYDKDGIVGVEAYVANEFEEIVDITALPPSIGDGAQQVWRMDRRSQNAEP